MCDPGTLTALAVATTVITAGAQVYAGSAAREQGRYENKVAQRNAEVLNDASADASRRGEIEERRRYRLLSQQMGEQRANMAAAGLDLSFGTASELVEDTALIGNEDVATIRENTRREMGGFDIEAANERSRGSAARSRGNAAFTSGLLSAGSTILSGAQQVGRINSKAV